MKPISKKIDPMASSARVAEVLRQIELQRMGQADDWRVTLRQKGFMRQADGSYLKE